MTDQRSRHVLPIPDRPSEGELPLDAKDRRAKFRDRAAPAHGSRTERAGRPARRDTASRLSDDYEVESSVFTGTVDRVPIDLGEDAEDADHLITPEERLRVAMARQ